MRNIENSMNIFKKENPFHPKDIFFSKIIERNSMTIMKSTMERVGIRQFTEIPFIKVSISNGNWQVILNGRTINREIKDALTKSLSKTPKIFHITIIIKIIKAFEIFSDAIGIKRNIKIRDIIKFQYFLNS